MIENDFEIEARDMTLDEVKTALKKYEAKYNMTSEEFYEKWKRGETYLISESVIWSTFFESYQIMNGKGSNNGRFE